MLVAPEIKMQRFEESDFDGLPANAINSTIRNELAAPMVYMSVTAGSVLQIIPDTAVISALPRCWSKDEKSIPVYLPLTYRLLVSRAIGIYYLRDKVYFLQRIANPQCKEYLLRTVL